MILFGTLIGVLAARFLPMPSTAPAPIVTPTPTPDPTTDWKTFSNANLFFKYPANLTLRERAKNYFSLLQNPEDIINSFVSIDARQTHAYANYDKAVASTSDSLTEVSTQDIKNGIKISGKLGPGEDEGLQVTMALLKYKEGAIEVETWAVDPSQLVIFDQILSTFKFTDTPSQLVSGIQLTQCCSCPAMIDASQIGKDGWVAYEKGKNYSAMRPKVCSSPNIGACKPCPSLESAIFTCPSTQWIDCMPGTDIVNYQCAENYLSWAKANCSGFKGAAL